MRQSPSSLARFTVVQLACLATLGVAPVRALADDSPVALFLARSEVPPERLRVHRHMEASCERLGARAWMDVLVERDPERGTRYTILGEGGSAMLRNKALRRVIETERRGQAEGGAAAADHSLANYAFSADGLAPDGSFRMRARPRRRDTRLIDGVFFLAADGELLRIEGRLARGPSFWTPSVEVVREYRRIAGRRVPVRHESLAHLRLLGGASRLVMSYSYEMVDGEVLAPATDVLGRPRPGQGGELPEATGP